MSTGTMPLSDTIWVALVFGAVIVTYFGMIFYLENVRLHMFMVALLTGLIAMCLWLMVDSFTQAPSRTSSLIFDEHDEER